MQWYKAIWAESKSSSKHTTYIDERVCVCACECIGDELYDHHIICAIIVALRLVCHSQSNVFVPTAHTHEREREEKRTRVLLSRKHTPTMYPSSVVSESASDSIYVYHIGRTAISRMDSNECKRNVCCCVSETYENTYATNERSSTYVCECVCVCVKCLMGLMAFLGTCFSRQKKTQLPYVALPPFRTQ